MGTSARNGLIKSSSCVNSKSLWLFSQKSSIVIFDWVLHSKQILQWESLRIHSECGKIRVIKTPNTDTFHLVNLKKITQADRWPKKKHLEWHIESRPFLSLSLFTSIKSKAAVKYGSFMFTSALILVIVAQAWYSIDLILSYIFQGGITVKYTSRWSNYAKLAQAVWNCEPFFPSIDPTQ